MIAPGELTTFMGLAFETNAEVLVPRPETELLARTVLELIPPNAHVIDMCCGAGNLGCALAHARPDIRVWASDLTDACATLARKNVLRHELGDRVTVVQGDLFAAIPAGQYDVIVCNPPYISSGKLAGDSAHLLENQPREAFDAGPYGFAIHKRVAAEAPTFLKPGGWLAMEIGLGQEKQIDNLVTRTKRYEATRLHNDEKGAPRAVSARVLAL